MTMNALTIENLTKIYSNGVQALNGISFSVKEGDFFALLGPNGAGKSTTIGIITSLVNKTSGKIAVFGHDIDHDFPKAKACVGVVPQEFNFSIFEKVLQVVVNQAGYYGIPKREAEQRAEKYLKKLQLWEKRDQQTRTLSGGMKRRLLIARALIHEPKLLILDEPTAGVDIEIRRSMWEFLREINIQGTTIILTTHYLEEAETLCKNIAIIDKGNLIKHTNMKSLLAQLHTETFVFYLKNPLNSTPKLIGFNTELLDDSTLAIELNSDQSLNDVFDQLRAQNIVINSMRNKVNRLEELFVRLTTAG